MSEFINTYLRNRWHDFSGQNYFDEHGIFMGVMWAGPLLILGFTMLVSETEKDKREKKREENLVSYLRREGMNVMSVRKGSLAWVHGGMLLWKNFAAAVYNRGRYAEYV